ncbi:hypothetical protein GCM10009121_00370 [Rhodanobacter soli]
MGLFSRHPALAKAHTAFCFAVVINFLVFAAVAYHLRGDALSGTIDAGRYFLGYKGSYTEVSKQVFEYSEVHALSVVITLPLAIVTGLLFGPHKKQGGA